MALFIDLDTNERIYEFCCDDAVDRLALAYRAAAIARAWARGGIPRRPSFVVLTSRTINGRSS